MTSRARQDLADRADLKAAFSLGKLVTAHDFNNLIRASYNLNNEGFHHSQEHGFECSSEGSFSGLMRFSKGGVGERQPVVDVAPGDICPSHIGWPQWALRFGSPTSNDLVFAPAQGDTATGLTMTRTGRVGVNTPAPACAMDVNGAVRSGARVGVSRAASAQSDAQEVIAYADGQWHSITPPMTGCQTLEVLAGAGKLGSGRYALVRAVAANAYNPVGWFFNFLHWKNRIRCQHAWYRSRLDKLRLRWHGSNRRYVLQIRSNSDYGTTSSGEPVIIRYHVTSLWTDPRMLQSRRLTGASA